MADLGFVSGFLGVEMTILSVVQVIIIALSNQKELTSFKYPAKSKDAIISQIRQNSPSQENLQQPSARSGKTLILKRIFNRQKVRDMGGLGKTLVPKRVFNSQKERDMGGSDKTLFLNRVFNNENVRDRGESGKTLVLKRGFNFQKVRDRVDPAKLCFSREFSTMDGSDKTLLLNRVFNRQKVRDIFGCGSLIEVLVLHGFSLTSLRNEHSRQITMQTKVDLNRNMKGKDAKIWLIERILGTKFSLRFSPFLDDIWEEGKLRRTQLTDHSKSEVIVSSRDDRALQNNIVNSGSCRNIHSNNGGFDGI